MNGTSDAPPTNTGQRLAGTKITIQAKVDFGFLLRLISHHPALEDAELAIEFEFWYRGVHIKTEQPSAVIGLARELLRSEWKPINGAAP